MSVQPPEKVQWRNVVIFSVLAYALAWALWSPGVVPRLGELLTSAATPQDFDDRFKVTTVLVMLTPMIAAIIMRRLVSREGLRHSLGPLRRWRYYLIGIGGVARREAATGILLGVILAAVMFPIISWLWHDAALAAAVSLAVMAASTVATMVAMALPYLLHRLGYDSAFGSDPLATVIQDLLSIVLYLTAVRLIL